MRRVRRPALSAAAALVAVAVAGCINLPTSGRVRNTGLPGSNGSEQVVQLVPRPPGAGWTPGEIVTGFLAATGSSLGGDSPGRSSLSDKSLSVARDYLAQGYRQDWHPALSSPTVIDSSLADLANSITWHPVPARVNAGPPAAVVKVPSTNFETLQPAGNIVVTPRAHVFEFSLVQTASGWRIETMPSNSLLLLTQPDFQRDYQPRNLYFFAGTAPSHVLVPYPVFIPQQAETQESAQALANDLLNSGQNGSGPAGWLSQATSTAFPQDAKVTSVQVSGIKAIVNLDLPASGSLTDTQLDQMEAQLFWTLTESPYRGGVLGIGSVQLVIRHGPSELLLPQMFSSWVPTVGGGQLYFQNLDAARHPVIESAGPSGPAAAPVPAGLGLGLFTAIAVAPAAGPAVLGACRGKTVYLTPLRSRARVVTQQLPSVCTSLSWDGSGNLWATTASDVYLLPAIRHGVPVPPQRVKVLISGLGLRPSQRILSFEVAPDGVRAAMIVRTSAGNQLMVAAISRNATYVFLAQAGHVVQVGSDISDPTALSWQNPDNLIVLGEPVGSTAQRYLFQVPLNGEPSSQSMFPVPPGVQWLAVDSQGGAVGAAGKIRGQIWQSRSWNGPWPLSAIRGSSPVYPG